MYLTHGKIISEYAQQSPIHLWHVSQFVYASINMRFERVPGILKRAQQTGSILHYSQLKRRGIAAWFLDRAAIHALVYDPTVADIDKLLYVSNLSGLGIVKAGFLLQCAIYNGRYGCLDRRNLTSLGLDIAATGFDAKQLLRPPTDLLRRRQLCADYLDLCQCLGGSMGLWDYWCIQLAQDRPQHFPSAEYVSLFHVDCILSHHFTL